MSPTSVRRRTPESEEQGEVKTPLSCVTSGFVSQLIIADRTQIICPVLVFLLDRELFELCCLDLTVLTELQDGLEELYVL